MNDLGTVRDLYGQAPPPSPEVTDGHRRVLAELIEAETPRHRPPDRRRGLARAAVAGATAAALAAAGWALTRSDATEAAAFACVSESGISVLANDGTPPVEVCRDLWEAGSMEPGVRVAPDLVACVSSEGVVEVVAGTGPDGCTDRGMATWTGQDAYLEAGAAVRTALVSLHDRYARTGDGCATVDDWRGRLEGWQLAVDTVEPDRHCLGLGRIDPTTAEIVLIGVPGDYSIGCDPRTGC